MNKIALTWPKARYTKYCLVAILWTVLSGTNYHRSTATVKPDVDKECNEDLLCASFKLVQALFLPGDCIAALPRPKESSIPNCYKPLQILYNQLHSLKDSYPNLVHIEKIGATATADLPIWGIKISDRPSAREDEPRILFTGVHHAREPIGANICIELARSLCANYEKNSQTKKVVDSVEIWLVPVVNPEGYQYMFNHEPQFPWWRKNLRDNDGDSLFNPHKDGVDLNRNYDFNWREGGDGKPESWFYRGSEPFSEVETQALRDLAERENFSMGASYHSYGEAILFPWGNYERPPDLDLIVDIAKKMAASIKRPDGNGTYSTLPLNGRVGQSSIWMYGHLKAIDFIVEVGTDYFPAAEQVQSIISENLKGANYLLNRLLETGIKGHVFDTHTNAALQATVMVKQFAADHVNPRRTEPQYGAYYLILNPGIYSLTVACQGYEPRTIYGVRVKKGEFTLQQAGLVRKGGYSNGRR